MDRSSGQPHLLVDLDGRGRVLVRADRGEPAVAQRHDIDATYPVALALRVDQDGVEFERTAVGVEGEFADDLDLETRIRVRRLLVGLTHGGLAGATTGGVLVHAGRPGTGPHGIGIAPA